MRPPCILRPGVLLAMSLGLVSLPAPAAPGDLDVSFHGTGWASFPAGGDGARGMAVQADGRVLLTGMSFAPDRPFQLAVWRVHPDGSRDTSFNGTGEVVGTFGGGAPSSGLAVAVQPDAKILAAGGYLSGGTGTYLLARCLPDGRLDPAFGTGGRGYVIDVNAGSAAVIALQGDGKILIGGGGGRVARFHADGSPDNTFGVNGVTPGPPAHPVTAIAALRDGKILVSKDGAFAVERLLPDGMLDTSFGTGGTVAVTFGAPDGFAVAQRLAVQDDDKILVAGNFSDLAADETGFAAARLLPEGGLDLTFGSAGSEGRATCSFGPGLFPRVSALRVQADGRILLAGHVIDDNAPADIALARFTAAGLPDATFGTSGRVRTDLGETGDECRAAALVSDQKLLVAGRLTGSLDPAAGDLLLARYKTPPEIAFAAEFPPGIELAPAPGAALDLGPVTSGTRVIAVVVRNTGLSPLAGLSATLTDESLPGEFSVAPPADTSLAPGAHTTVVVTLTPSTAPGVRTATLRLAGTTPGLPLLAISLTGSRATPLEVWRFTWFGSPDNSGPGADLNDFDGDGLVNFMEYATASHPHLPSPSPCAVVPNGAAAAMTYTRPASALTGFSYQPESAASPAGPWTSSGLTSTVLTTAGDLQTVQVTATDPAASRFFRLRVTRP